MWPNRRVLPGGRHGATDTVQQTPILSREARTNIAASESVPRYLLKTAFVKLAQACEAFSEA
jgi:hypothetical protein